MRRVILILKIVVAVLVASFLYYTLPRHDIARITGTEVIRQDLSSWNRLFHAGADAGNVRSDTRDLRLVNAQRLTPWFFGLFTAGEQTIVYRNEDTGWEWPPYFKFDSADVQARAQDLTSTADAPRWAVITRYGLRSRMLSIYPNIIAVRPIADERPAVQRLTPPDIRIIPWFNIFFFIAMALLWGFLRAAWRGLLRGTKDEDEDTPQPRGFFARLFRR